jgi:thymidylate synthase
MHQRSKDRERGLPVNITGYWILTHRKTHRTNLRFKVLIYTIRGA